MVGSDVEAQWYVALYEEDCLRVMSLLQEHPRLWKQGWESEPKRIVKSWTLSPWKGRTALHVGARKGCAKLLNQVLQLCKEEQSAGSVQDVEVRSDMGGHSSEGPEEEEPSNTQRGYPEITEEDPQESAGVSKSVSDLLLEKDGEYQLDAIAMAMVNGNSEIVSILLEAILLCPDIDEKCKVSYFLLEKLQTERAQMKRDQMVKQFQMEKHKKKLREVTEKVILKLAVDPTFKEEILEKYARDRDFNFLPRGEYLFHFLFSQRLFKDTHEHMRCTALAVLGNEVFKSLPSDTRDTPCSFLSEKLHDDQLGRLPLHVALDHCNIDRVFGAVFGHGMPGEHAVLGNEVFETSPSDTSDTLWSFLWEELQDGQGRLPLHVAVDHRNIDSVFGAVFGHSMPGSPESIERIIKAVDGGGRTAFHRAIMQDNRYAFSCADDIFYFLGRYKGYDDYLEVVDRDSEKENFFFTKQSMLAGTRTVSSPVVLEALREYKEDIVNSKTENSREIITRAFIKSFTTCQVYKCSPASVDLINTISRQNGFTSSNPLHTTPIDFIIVQKKIEYLELLSKCYETLRHKVGLEKTVQSSIHNLLGTTNSRTPNKLSRTARMDNRWLSTCTVSQLRHIYNNFDDSLIGPWRLVEEVGMDALMLAILVGEESAVRNLLAWEKKFQVSIFSRSIKLARKLDKKFQGPSYVGEKFPTRLGEGLVSIYPLHLATIIGQYGVLKCLTDHKKCDPSVEDYGGNNALHHALHHATSTRKSFKFETHLLDYVSCEEIRDFREDLKDGKAEPFLKKEEDQKNEETFLKNEEDRKNEESLIARQGCINLLIQFGCDILHTNNDGQVPYPGIEATPKFRTWWYEKQDKEFVNRQNALGGAASAISVTAALVATASYVGPLQPPLGYDEHDRLQLNNIWVKIFIVCDTLSFYLAIAAIISSLIPSLPMPQQSMMAELRHTRRMVTTATSILFPSIIFVLVAFASGSIGVAHPNGGSWNNGDLTIVTAAIGGLFCLVIIVLFFIRLVKIIFGRKFMAWMRKNIEDTKLGRLIYESGDDEKYDERGDDEKYDESGDDEKYDENGDDENDW